MFIDTQVPNTLWHPVGFTPIVGSITVLLITSFLRILGNAALLKRVLCTQPDKSKQCRMSEKLRNNGMYSVGEKINNG